MDKYKSLDGIFAALGDPTRRAVVSQLGLGVASVSELAAPHAMALPSFMKHLRVLERAGLVRSSKRGRTRTCSLVRGSFLAAEDWLEEQRAMWGTPSERGQEDDDEW